MDEGIQQVATSALESEDSKGAKGFWQCVVFYGTPIGNEIVAWEDEKVKKKTPKALRDELENQKFIFPFYSSEIFPTEFQAKAFLPGFVRELIEKHYLPPEVLDEKQILRDDVCKAAVAPLKFSVIEEG